MHKIIRASQYIESIRHAAMKQYAREYYQWLVNGGEESEQPNPDRGSLSYMAAQAVRIELRSIMSVDQ